MSAVSNIDALVVPELACVPGTMSARLEALRGWTGTRPASPEAAVALSALVRDCAPVSGMDARPVEKPGACATCAEVSVMLGDGTCARGRLVVPALDRLTQGAVAQPARLPLVLMFHDAGRPIRGWHHLLRFAPLGCAVLALDGGIVDAQDAEAAMEGLARRALGLAQAGLALPCVDPARVCTWGEGVGGALAVLVAEALPGKVARCAACCPFPLDRPGLPAHVDALCMASSLRGDLLVGTPLLDEVASVEAQAALVNRAGAGSCRVQQVFYPRHAHERVNDFENRMLDFLRFGCHTA